MTLGTNFANFKFINRGQFFNIWLIADGSSVDCCNIHNHIVHKNNKHKHI